MISSVLFFLMKRFRSPLLLTGDGEPSVSAATCAARLAHTPRIRKRRRRIGIPYVQEELVLHARHQLLRTGTCHPHILPTSLFNAPLEMHTHRVLEQLTDGDLIPVLPFRELRHFTVHNGRECSKARVASFLHILVVMQYMRTLPVNVSNGNGKVINYFVALEI